MSRLVLEILNHLIIHLDDKKSSLVQQLTLSKEAILELNTIFGDENMLQDCYIQ